jgi:hypothetical protein
MTQTLHRRPLHSVIAAAAALAAPLAMAASPLPSLEQSVLMPVAQTATTITFDVAGVFSFDGYGSPINDVYFLQVGSLGTIDAVAWDVVLVADAPSLLSEMKLDFSNSTSTVGVTLAPGSGADMPGTQAFTSGGLVSLVDLNLAFQVGADGLLRLEFWESDVDYPNDWDGFWESGTLTFGVTPIPEPGTYALMALGLLAVGGAAQRRRRG